MCNSSCKPLGVSIRILIVNCNNFHRFSFRVNGGKTKVLKKLNSINNTYTLFGSFLIVSYMLMYDLPTKEVYNGFHTASLIV